MIKEGVTPAVKAKELVIYHTMIRIEELETESYDRKVVKQMKKLVNRLARDIGADDQYFDVV